MNTNRMVKENFSMNGVGRLTVRYWIKSFSYHLIGSRVLVITSRRYRTFATTRSGATEQKGIWEQGHETLLKDFGTDHQRGRRSRAG